MKYIVNLNPEWDEIEDFQENDDNIMDVRVYDAST